MRFKAKMSRLQATALQNILGPHFSPRIAPDAVVHLSPTHLRLSVRGVGTSVSRFAPPSQSAAAGSSAAASEGIGAFVELDAGVLFQEMRIQSAAEDNVRP